MKESQVEVFQVMNLLSLSRVTMKIVKVRIQAVKFQVHNRYSKSQVMMILKVQYLHLTYKLPKIINLRSQAGVVAKLLIILT